MDQRRYRDTFLSGTQRHGWPKLVLRNGGRWPKCRFKPYRTIGVHSAEYRSSPTRCTRETRTRYALRTARCRRVGNRRHGSWQFGTNNETTVNSLWYGSTRSGRTRKRRHRRSKTAIRVRRPSGRRLVSNLFPISNVHDRESARPFSQCSRLVPYTPSATRTSAAAYVIARRFYLSNTRNSRTPAASKHGQPDNVFLYIIL